jgi:hypothetical protein
VVVPSRVSSVRASSFAPGDHSGGGGHDSRAPVDPERLAEFGGALARLSGLTTQAPYSILTKLLAVAAVIGFVALLRTSLPKALVLGLPFALVGIATAGELYPVFERTIVFLVPASIVLVTHGIALLARRAGRLPVTIVLTVLVLASPAVAAVKNIVNASTPEAIKPVLLYVREHWRDGDVLYVHYASQYAFAYYSECGCLDLTRPGDSLEPLWPVERVIPEGTEQYATATRSLAPEAVRIGAFVSNAEDELQALEELRSHRVWFVTGGSPGVRYVAFHHTLERHGRRLQALELPTVAGHYPATALLYDLRPTDQ